MSGKIDTIRVGTNDYDIDLKSSSMVSITSLSTIGDISVGSNLSVTGSVTSGNINPATNKGASLGTSSYYWNNIYGTTIYENGTSLANKYIDKSIFNSAGDLLVGSGDNAYTRLVKGSNGTFLGVNSSGNVAWVSNPNTDTKNTAGSTNSASKLFLVGASSQAENPQTYSNNMTYVTNGVLNAKSFAFTNTSSVASSKAIMQYNATEDCIEFIFA